MSFYKPVLLPSNGIPYDPIIHIMEPDVSLLLSIKNNFINNSESELIFSVIKKYTSIEYPEKYYFNDIQYLWFLFLSTVNNSTLISVPYVCYDCTNSTTLKIDTSELQLNYAKKDNFKNKVFQINDFVFEFRNRLFGDNIITGISTISNSDVLVNIKNFLKPQCVKILHGGKEYDSDFFEDALLEIGINHSSELFDSLKDEEWGLISYIHHKCKKCNTNNKVYVSDSFRSSIYYSNSKISQKMELLDTLITLSSFKVINFNELLNIPISIFEPTIKKIEKILKKKYNSKNSTSNYFEDLEEELG
jgi:hypothetical protein